MKSFNYKSLCSPSFQNTLKLETKKRKNRTKSQTSFAGEIPPLHIITLVYGKISLQYQLHNEEKLLSFCTCLTDDFNSGITSRLDSKARKLSQLTCTHKQKKPKSYTGLCSNFSVYDWIDVSWHKSARKVFWKR